MLRVKGRIRRVRGVVEVHGLKINCKAFLSISGRRQHRAAAHLIDIVELVRNDLSVGPNQFQRNGLVRRIIIHIDALAEDEVSEPASPFSHAIVSGYPPNCQRFEIERFQIAIWLFEEQEFAARADEITVAVVGIADPLM